MNKDQRTHKAIQFANKLGKEHGIAQRDAEVKKVIEELIDTTTIIGISYDNKKVVCQKLLQKLGLLEEEDE